MSAFMVSRDHIDAMVALAIHGQGAHLGPIRWFAIDPDTIEYTNGTDYLNAIQDASRTVGRGDMDRAHEVGAMLALENAASVLYRYPDHDNSEYVPSWTTDGSYRWGWSPVRHRVPSPVEGLRIIDTYEYQSCEHPGWADSEARRFCDSLRRALIGALPGYSEAPHEWTHEVTR